MYLHFKELNIYLFINLFSILILNMLTCFFWYIIQKFSEHFRMWDKNQQNFKLCCPVLIYVTTQYMRTENKIQVIDNIVLHISLESNDMKTVTPEKDFYQFCYFVCFFHFQYILRDNKNTIRINYFLKVRVQRVKTQICDWAKYQNRHSSKIT